MANAALVATCLRVCAERKENKSERKAVMITLCENALKRRIDWKSAIVEFDVVCVHLDTSLSCGYRWWPWKGGRVEIVYVKRHIRCSASKIGGGEALYMWTILLFKGMYVASMLNCGMATTTLI